MKIILVRHGQTGKDKNNSGRVLTKAGTMQINKSATRIKSLVDGKVLVVCTQTVRTVQTAMIISKKINADFVQTNLPLRISGIEKLATDSNIDLTFDRYLPLFKKGLLSPDVAKPNVIINSFKKLVETYKSSYQTLIIVGHAGGLEVIALFQKKFKTNKMPKKELKYGEIVVLEGT